MASGWNLWVWLPCIGMVSGCPYSTCISSFLAAASLLLCSFLKCFFGLVSVIFLQYIARYSKNIRDRSKKSRSREYNYLIISIMKTSNVRRRRARARVPTIPSARYRMTFD